MIFLFLREGGVHVIKMILHYVLCRPDMTFAVDWALSNNYLSIMYYTQ